jgi:hypothetical protein
MRYKETIKGGKKKKEGASDGKQMFDFDALPGEGGQAKAWGACESIFRCLGFRV